MVDFRNGVQVCSCGSDGQEVRLSMAAKDRWRQLGWELIAMGGHDAPTRPAPWGAEGITRFAIRLLSRPP